jgi:hypothetical protein
MDGGSSDLGFDLSGYDLSPDVSLWVGIGLYPQDKGDYDIVFAVDTDKQLRKISDYYGLLYPLPKNESIDINPHEWHSKDYEISAEKIGMIGERRFRDSFKLGSIKFHKDKPKLLKMYKSNFKDKDYARNRD